MGILNSKINILLPAVFILTSCTAAPYVNNETLNHTFPGIEQLSNKETSGEVLLLERMESSLIISNLNSYFNIDGSVVERTTIVGSKSFTLKPEGDNVESIALTVNEVDNMFPLWTYYNPNTAGDKCCSCGFCGGESSTVNSHLDTDHDPVNIAQKSLQLQADKIISTLGFIRDDYECFYENGWVNKIECSIIFEGQKTPLMFSFFFDSAGELHTATGQGFIIKEYDIQNYVSRQESANRLNNREYHVQVFNISDGPAAKNSEVFTTILDSVGLFRTPDNNFMLTKSFTYLTKTGVMLSVTALKNDVTYPSGG